MTSLEKEILGLEKMIKNNKEYLRRRISNNGHCETTRKSQEEQDRWQKKLDKLKAQ